MRTLFVAEWRRTVVQLLRYPSELASEAVVLFVVFAGLFFGAQYISSGPIAGGRLSTVVLGYGVWMLMMSATGEMGWSIQAEAQNGTLEQVMLAPWPPVVVFLARALTAVLTALVPQAVIIAALIFLTGASFVLSPLAVVPILFAIVGSWGLGLIVAAGALVLKRVTQLLQVIQFGLLFLIVAPLSEIPGVAGHAIASVVPFSAAVAVLHASLSGGAGPSPALWIEAAVNTALVFAAGIFLFRRADILARARGILGHY